MRASQRWISPLSKGRDVIKAAHKQAAQAIKAEQSDLPVDLTIAMQDMQAVEGGKTVRDRVRQEL